MRILLVSYDFPPFNCIGAVRVGKTAKYLHLLGHDVRVVCADDQPLPKTLPVEIPESQIVRTPWINVNALPELLLGGRERVAREGYVPRGSGRTIWGRLRRIYKAVLNFPDGRVGWGIYAYRAAGRMIQGWRPDVIYASAMPFTSHLVAARLSARYRIPWVAEFRDLWTDHPSYSYGLFRRTLDEHLERRTLSGAAAMVTVSEPLATTLRRKYNKPTAVITNGYDPSDYPEPKQLSSASDTLRIVYTGTVYEGRQDPSPLFRAINRLGALGRRVRVEFYGRYVESVRALATKLNVQDQVQTFPAIPYKESLAKQVNADLLLLLLWNDESQPGVYTGKLFEYIGAGRPILAIGPLRNVAAELIREKSLGIVTNDEAELTSFLTKVLEDRAYLSCIRLAGACDEYSREYQTRSLVRFLEETLR